MYLHHIPGKQTGNTEAVRYNNFPETQHFWKFLCSFFMIDQTESFVIILIHFHTAVTFCDIFNIFLILIPKSRYIFINSKMRNQKAVLMNLSDLNSEISLGSHLENTEKPFPEYCLVP